MNGLARRLAQCLLQLAAQLLPARLSTWARAMACELTQIAGDLDALRFAIGCLRAAIALALAARLQAIGAAARHLRLSASAYVRMDMDDISARPRRLGLFCGATAVGMGLVYMFMADAPLRYLVVNLTTLMIGAIAWLAIGRSGALRANGAGRVVLALASLLLFTALFGVAADGASRWVRVGSLNLQVSLIFLPAMITLYARRPDPIGTIGLMLAALALAAQPDRAMAGVLLAALLPLVVTTGRLPFMAAAAAALAFTWTLVSPDTLPAVPYVDRVFHTAFDAHPIAWLAVAIGAVALLVPAVIGIVNEMGDRSLFLAFGGCWAGILTASALGNYPTPVVGYGGSAVLGYLLSVALLPTAADAKRPSAVARRDKVDGRVPDRTKPDPRVAGLA